MSAPNAWIDLIGQLRQAQVARHLMRNVSATQQRRDEATVVYCRAMDAVFDRLDQMMEQGVLGRISTFLSARGRV